MKQSRKVYFETNKKVSVLYFTADGRAFSQKEAAEAHAAGLKRKGKSDQVQEELRTDHYPMEQVETAADGSDTPNQDTAAGGEGSDETAAATESLEKKPGGKKPTGKKG